MVDLVDIGFSVDSSQIKTAKQELAELGNSFNSATKSASIFEQAFARAAAQSAKDAKFVRDTIRANQELINTNLGVSNSYKSAKDSASAFGVVLNNIDKASKAFTTNFNSVAGVTGSRATSKGAGFGAIENEIERLSLKYNQIYASSKLYEKSLEELNRAHMLGVTSTKQHEAALESLNMEYQNFQNGVVQAGNRFAQYTAQSASGLGKFGVATQQLGYQVGDFLVQVQSGTNWMVAFGQQATQLVGVLPSLAGTLGMSVSSLIAISTGLGIAIPLVTAIGAYFMRTGESANKAKDQLSDLDTAIKNIDESLKKWVQTKQAAAAGMTIDQMFGGQSLEQAKSDLAAAQKALAEFTAQSSVNNIGQGGAAAGIALSDWLIGTLKQGDLSAAEKLVADAAKRVADIQVKLSGEQKASYEEQYASLMQNYAMEKTIAKFGSDSAEVKKLELRQALDDYNRQIDAQVKSNEISVAQGDTLKLINRAGQEAVVNAEEAAKAEVKKAEVIQAAADKSTYLKNVFHAMAGEAGAVSVELGSWAGAIIDATNASSGLKDFLLKMRIDTGMKGRGLPADYYGMTTAPVDTGKLFGNIEFGPNGAVIKPEEDKKAAGGGGSKKDPLVELQKQIALQEELNGKTEAEQKVRQALGDDYSKYSPTIIKGLEEQIQKQIELEDHLKEQQGLYDTIQSSMEDAFMSMVDGTKSAKDAFKSMAAAIIKELYNVLVVQQLVGSFNRSTGTGSGIVGMIGSALIKPKANGGPISAGMPYLVGERGPELIVPKSSGTVLTNGQTKAALGGASNDNYTVNNHINVTGSDSVMVRQEIAKMIPQISSATKAAMIDAKRRGGQMGAAFR